VTFLAEYFRISHLFFSQGWLSPPESGLHHTGDTGSSLYAWDRVCLPEIRAYATGKRET
jgi:hypothetical protein